MTKLKKKVKTNRGMSYVELIVVLSIFSVLSSVSIFSYGNFQATVDTKNLANDIALKIIEAQRQSLAGAMPVLSPTTSPWKPSYGVHFDTITDNASFIYFTDLDNSTYYDGTDCTGECLGKITITQGNTISNNLNIVGTDCPSTVMNLNILFKRPDSSAIITSNPAFPSGCSLSYAEIVVLSPKSDSISANIRIYPSGRVQIN